MLIDKIKVKGEEMNDQDKQAGEPGVRELVERLDKMVSIAERVDGWASVL